MVLGGLNRQSANLPLADLGPWAKSLSRKTSSNHFCFELCLSAKSFLYLPLFILMARCPGVEDDRCKRLLCRFAMIYHMSKEVARNRADTMPALPAVVNAAIAAKYPHLPSPSASAKFPHSSSSLQQSPSCSTSVKQSPPHPSWSWNERRKMASSSPKKKNDGSTGLSKQASDLRIK